MKNIVLLALSLLVGGVFSPVLKAEEAHSAEAECPEKCHTEKSDTNASCPCPANCDTEAKSEAPKA